MKAVIAISVFHWHPRHARGSLLQGVADGFFNAVHYPGFAVVIAAFSKAFGEAHEAFPFFENSAGFPIGEECFLFRRHLHAIPLSSIAA